MSVLGSSLVAMTEVPGPRALPFGIGIDVADPSRMADFWQGLTGYRRAEHTDRHVFLVHPERLGPGIYLHRVPEPRPPAKNRVHIELWVDDLAAAALAVRRLGGRQLADFPTGSPDEPDMTFAVFDDPEGNVFCLGQR
jgi:catechol 2,3-dioxygenase-like lactoylglutathione lyase family enzyme